MGMTSRSTTRPTPTLPPGWSAVRRMSTARGGRGGSIVLLSSVASMLGGAGEFVTYAATKGAIDTLTLGLAREGAKDGVRVNAGRPGVTETILFLLSDAASYVTGALLNVTGGR